MGQITMSGQLATLPAQDDPSRLGWPPTLAMEIALAQMSPKDICKAYNISKDQWDVLRKDALFIKDVEAAVNELKKDGVSFKVKARLQAEALLPRVWKMAHSPYHEVPPNVQADLIKFTVRAAGLDGSKDQGIGAVGGGTALQININVR